MTDRRYYRKKHYFRDDEVHDLICNRFLDINEVVELLNRLEKDRQFLKELKVEYKRVSRILDDFMNIANRLQANPNDEVTQMIARDMLLMMGVDLE